jgi:UrcA family protein
VTFKNYKRVSAFPVGVVVMGLALSHSAALAAGELKVSNDGIPTVGVVYTGMDLSTNTGATQLYQRLKHAARQVCSKLESRDLSRRAQWQRCYDKALADAVTQVDKPLLTALLQKGQSPLLTPTTVAADIVKPAG